MDINEAIAIAAQMKNTWRAFARLEEFLTEVASLMRVQKELEATVSSLEESAEEKRKALEELASKIPALQEEYERTKRHIEADRNRLISEIQASVQTFREKAEQMKQQIQAEIEALELKKQETLQGLSALEAQEKELQSKIAMARKSLTSLLDRIKEGADGSV